MRSSSLAMQSAATGAPKDAGCSLVGSRSHSKRNRL